MTPVILLVLDGWGLRRERTNNAIALARTPVFDELLARYPHAQLITSGEAVGLPAGQMGNSEVGHMNMGAGRIVYQDLTRIDKSIAEGEIFSNRALVAAMDHAAAADRALHFIGLVSDGGVHSHERHLHALVDMAARRRLARVFVHVITDGRDTSPTGGVRYIGKLQEVMSRLATGRIASVSGRYYAMDRDKRWERTRLAYDAIVHGNAATHALSPLDVVRQSYESGTTDEFVKPAVITDPAGAPLATIRSDDSVVCFNFRADRARQLTRAIALDEFDGFDRPARPRVLFTTMTVYDRTFKLPVIFEPQSFTGNMADILESSGRTNLRLAETEKYAHVTYFFNCGREQPYEGEDRVLVPSQKVATYDLMPEMSAPGITDALVDDLARRRHDVVICNFANADMVGHTGKLGAAIAAVETLDGCIGRIITAAADAGGLVLVTADHGNAEQMWDDELDAPHTAHTSNPVPVVLCADRFRNRRLRDGSLRDVAPTLLQLLGITPPKEMTGSSLLED